ncbi:MAG: hypothetical protein RML12_03595 [Xanthomonadales bacterium]|nr:hypothetical protein [Xanthomonadales bacterium]
MRDSSGSKSAIRSASAAALAQPDAEQLAGDAVERRQGEEAEREGGRAGDEEPPHQAAMARRGGAHGPPPRSPRSKKAEVDGQRHQREQQRRAPGLRPPRPEILRLSA